MRFKGHTNAEELSDFLKNESDRCVVIVAAAFFDETLGRLLGERTERPLNSRINDARDYGILSQDEHDDLHKIRQLRNQFAHNLRAAAFDTNVCAAVESMAIWKTASSQIVRYVDLFRNPRDRFLYVVGVIAFRLQHRQSVPPRVGPLPEPPITDIHSWPPVTND